MDDRIIKGPDDGEVYNHVYIDDDGIVRNQVKKGKVNEDN